METDTAARLSALPAGLTLRRAAPDDFSAVRAVLARCGLYTTSVTPEGSTYWLAESGGEVLGCIGLEHGEGASLLRSAAVVPEARSLGVGRQLAEAVVAAATARGDRTLFLFSSDAGEYWQRFGFVPSAAAAVEAALPQAPQVRSGMCKGWIHEEQVWSLDLSPPSGAPGGPA